MININICLLLKIGFLHLQTVRKIEGIIFELNTNFMKKILALFFSVFAIGILMSGAQTKSITGRVTSAGSGNPIPGVSVVAKGTTLGTVTNSEGEFLLHLPQSANTLVFSYIGMKPVEKNITGPKVNVALEPQFTGVPEVVVLGYSRKEKDKITGSVVQVEGEEIANVPVTSFEQALHGKVPGLTVFTSSGTPGSLHDIRIRGVGSITAGNSPLFVIDGVPVINEDFSGYENQSSFSSLAALNSSDIESITVLKDASATSAFGARGSNGVIVITTKKGSPGETRFNANATIGFQNNAVEGLKPLTGAQKAELLVEAVNNTFGSDRNFSEEEAIEYLSDELLFTALKNWNGEEGNWYEVLQNKNAPVQDYDISAAGGDEVSSFYVSLGYNKTEATTVGSDFERFTGKLNYQRDFSSVVNFSANVSISSANQNGIVEPSVYFRNPHVTRYLMSPWEQPYLDDGETLNTNVASSVFNNLYTLKNDILTNNLVRGIANSSIEWKVTEKFSLKSLFAVDYNLAAYHNYVNRNHGDGINAGGFTNQSISRNFNYVSQNSVNYRFNMDEHSFRWKAILEYQENKYNYLSGHGENFTLDGLTYIEVAGSNFDASSFFTDWKHVSYLGILNYDFAEKYLVDLTYRNEGSSKFVPDKRFGSFWSAGSAWNISKEDFLEGKEWVNDLRLKASFGTSGNSAIGINRYQALLSFDANYAGVGAIYPGQFGNPALTWEKNSNLNVGLDFGFINNRFSGSFSWYNKKTSDLLQEVPVSRTSGHPFVMMNAGEMINNGLEALINAAVFRSEEFNFNVTANIATVNNEVTELATDANGEEINIETNSQKVAVGHSVYGWYMREWAGVNTETGNAQWYLNGEGSEITENYSDPNIEKVWQGTPIPKYTGGLSVDADFKGFFANVGFYFAGGHNVYEDFSLFTHHSGKYTLQWYNGVEPMLDRWRQPGDVTDVPKVIYDLNSDSDISSRFLYDGEYVRLKNLVFGYNIPSNVTRDIGFRGITLSVRGTNLFTWVKDKRLKYDPEVSASGLTSLNTPPVKSVVFGVNLKF